MVAASVERQFVIIVKVDGQSRKTDLSMVYTNDPIMVENSINPMEQLLGDDDKYKVVGFNLEYTDGHASEKKKRKDSRVDLTAAITNLYNRDMKAKCDNYMSVSQKAWVNELDENTSSTSPRMCTKVEMRKCLLPADGYVGVL
ncbi:methyltransferase pmt27 [Hordeum vulgare]|nr:methyltransferase pmt27 [Hordeum vulgare]